MHMHRPIDKKLVYNMSITYDLGYVSRRGRAFGIPICRLSLYSVRFNLTGSKLQSTRVGTASRRYGSNFAADRRDCSYCNDLMFLVPYFNVQLLVTLI